MRFEGASGPTASARVADIKKARDAVAAAAASAASAASAPAEPDLDAIADAQTIVLGQDEPGVSLEADVPKKVVLRRRGVRVRLIGMFFDHSKTFVLPDALTGIKKVNEIYNELPDANLLVVGHTDTRHLDSPDADPDFNKKLSLDRAKSVAQFLTDDVDGWYAWYGSWGERLWGAAEDKYMLANVPSADPPYYQDGDDYKQSAKRYQTDRGLPATGSPGERTRRALIRDYMSTDGTTLRDGATLTSHGCGPNFPDVPTGPNEDVPQNRRVEIFAFDGPIVPPPPGDYSKPGSPEYPAWVAQVLDNIDFTAGQITDENVLRVRLHDADANPMTTVRYRVTTDGQSGPVTETATGWAVVQLPTASRPGRVTLEWGTQDESKAFPFRRDLHVDCQSGSEREQWRAQLHNLGYESGAGDDDEAALRAFQIDYGLGELGLVESRLPPATANALCNIYGTCVAQRDRAAVHSEPDAGGKP